MAKGKVSGTGEHKYRSPPAHTLVVLCLWLAVATFGVWKPHLLGVQWIRNAIEAIGSPEDTGP